jgi:hypothetical protein
MNANKGVLVTLFAVLAFSAMLCQAQVSFPLLLLLYVNPQSTFYPNLLLYSLFF